MDLLRGMFDEELIRALWEEGVEKAIELARMHGIPPAYVGVRMMQGGSLILAAAANGVSCGPKDLAWCLDELKGLGITPNLRMLER